MYVDDFVELITTFWDDELTLIARSLSGNCPLMFSPSPLYSVIFVSDRHTEQCLWVFPLSSD